MKKHMGVCKYAHDYWPMYCGRDQRKWGTVRCDRSGGRVLACKCEKGYCAKYEEAVIDEPEPERGDLCHED